MVWSIKSKILERSKFRILQEEYILNKIINNILSITARCKDTKGKSTQWFVNSSLDMIVNAICFILQPLGCMGPENASPESKCADRLDIMNHIVVIKLPNLEVSFLSEKGSIEIAKNSNLKLDHDISELFTFVFISHRDLARHTVDKSSVSSTRKVALVLLDIKCSPSSRM